MLLTFGEIMKSILLILITLFLASCGIDRQRFNPDPPPPYFLEDGWRRNNQTYSNGSKVDRHVRFTIPNSIDSWVRVQIVIPKDRGNGCLYGRILSTDYSKFLSYEKYKVVDCIEDKNGYHYQAVLEFWDMPESIAVFDFRGDD